jgi:hypothetical protein
MKKTKLDSVYKVTVKHPNDNYEKEFLIACQNLAKNNIDKVCEGCEFRFKCWTETHEQ